MSTNGKGPTLKITDMTDREVLTILAEIEGTDGWVDVQYVAEALWPRRSQTDPEHCRRAILSRLGWIRRMSGMVEKHDSERRLYRLTEEGETFLKLKVGIGVHKAITATHPLQLAEVLSLVGRRYIDLSDEVAWIVRREWQHREGRR